jgi:hypothetical protein
LTRVVPQSVLISPKVSLQACMQMPASNASMQGADSREPDALIRLLHHHSLLLTHVLMAGSLHSTAWHSTAQHDSQDVCAVR